MSGKNKINLKRNSAFAVTIGTPDDRSGIDTFIEIDGVLHIIKGQGVYTLKLADQIDPARTNEVVPNVDQRVLGYGSDNEIVCRTLLTAKRLFNPLYLGQSFNHSRALSLTFEMLKDLMAAHELAVEFRNEDDRGKAQILNQQMQGASSLSLPSSDGLKSNVESFIQKLDHAYVSLFEIVKLFYPDCSQRKWFDSFYELVAQKHGKDAPFAVMLEEALWFLRFIRSMRTAIEHKDKDQQIRIYGFELDAKMVILLPSVELISSETPHSRVSVADLTMRMVERFSKIAELLFAHMCNHNAQPFAGFSCKIVMLPAEQRQNKQVQFSYGMYDGKKFIPIG